MKIIRNQRGFIFLEFVMALPLLILLLYALGTLTLYTAKIAREQVADYVLETEAQYVIDKITEDARAAYSVKINHVSQNIEEIILVYHTIQKKDQTFYDVFTQRRYTVSSPNNFFCVYAERLENGPLVNSITGDNSYGKTFVKQLDFEIEDKILFITLEMQSVVTEQKVKFKTAVYMPAYGEDIYAE